MTPLVRTRLFRPAWPLVACVAIVTLWPASEVWTGWAAVGAGGHRLVVEVGPGWLGVTAGPTRTANRAFVGPGSGWPPSIRLRRLTDADRRALAFPQIYPMPGEYRFYSPLWMVTLSASLFAAGLLASRARRHTPGRPGLCPRCGYDLRASPDRCPECGQPSPQPSV